MINMYVLVMYIGQLSGLYLHFYKLYTYVCDINDYNMIVVFFPGFDRFIPGFDRFIPGFDRFIPASIPVTGTLPSTIQMHISQ